MDLINHRLKSTYVKHTDLVLGAWSVFGRTDHHVDVAALVRLVQMFSDGQNRSSSLSPTLYPERGEHAIHHLDITLQLHPEVWPGKRNSPWMKKKNVWSECFTQRRKTSAKSNASCEVTVKNWSHIRDRQGCQQQTKAAPQCPPREPACCPTVGHFLCRGQREFWVAIFKHTLNQLHSF